MAQKLDEVVEDAYVAYAEGDFARAESACAEVLRKAPRNEPALCLLAEVRLRNGDATAAVALLQKAVKIRPADDGLLEALANAQVAAGDNPAAEQTLKRALKLATASRGSSPARGESVPAGLRLAVNLGLVQERLGRNADAIASYRRALEIVPDSVHALSNLAKALRAERRIAEAKEACLHALRVDPQFTDARVNLAAVLAEEGDAQGARTQYEAALEQEPQAADLQYSYAALALALGDFETGWRAYRWRPTRRRAEAAGLRLDTTLPERIEGARIAVLGEQGLGDEFFFLRYARELALQGASVHVQCDARLAGMVERGGAFASVLTPEAKVPAAQCVVVAGDLPLLVDRSGAPLPSPLALQPLDERVERWRATLAAFGPAPYVALTWRAGTQPARQIDRPDRALYKEVPPQVLATALQRLPGTLVAIQREPHAGEIAGLSGLLEREVHDGSGANDDLEEMLALLALIDEYIGVSNTNMHLRAGLGRTARVLVPHPPEWRWMWSGTRSSWFPGFDVYREAHGGGWDAAAGRLAEDLADALRGNKA